MPTVDTGMQRACSNQALLLQVLIGLAVIHVTLIVLKFLHSFLLEYFVPTFLLEFFGN